jgi:hypothetical protein
MQSKRDRRPNQSERNPNQGELVKTTRTSTIVLPIVAMLTLGVAGVYAQESVRMTFSGTSENSANNLQIPNTGMDEDNFAGRGALGTFTVGLVRAISNSPSASSTCSGLNKLHFSEPAGGGIFRFEDGSLLYVQLTSGDDCIDFAAFDAHCMLVFSISGGTGRFTNASGTLKLSEIVVPVLVDASNNPVYTAATGVITGTISGVGD